MHLVDKPKGSASLFPARLNRFLKSVGSRSDSTSVRRGCLGASFWYQVSPQSNSLQAQHRVALFWRALITLRGWTITLLCGPSTAGWSRVAGAVYQGRRGGILGARPLLCPGSLGPIISRHRCVPCGHTSRSSTCKYVGFTRGTHLPKQGWGGSALGTVTSHLETFCSPGSGASSQVDRQRCGGPVWVCACRLGFSWYHYWVPPSSLGTWAEWLRLGPGETSLSAQWSRGQQAGPSFPG